MIRIATPNDLLSIAHHGKQFYPGFVEQCFIQTWTMLMKGGFGIMWVWEESGCIVGAMGVLMVNDANDGALMAVEMVWHVLPEHRGSIGLRLYQHLERWSLENNVQRIIMGEPAGTSQPFEPFLKKHGFELSQTVYKKDLCRRSR